MRKNTNALVRERRRDVAQSWADGGLPHWRVTELAEQYDVSERQIYLDRAIVLKELQDQVEFHDKGAAKSSLIARARELYFSSKDSRPNAAAKCLDFEARVLGAYDPVQIDVTNQVDHLDDLELARQVLNPDAHAWARETLRAAGEVIVIEGEVD